MRLALTLTLLITLAACGDDRDPPPAGNSDATVRTDTGIAGNPDATAADAEAADAGFADSGIEDTGAGNPDALPADSGETPDSGVAAPTFTQVYAVIEANCSCHVNAGTTPLMPNKNAAHAALVGVQAVGLCNGQYVAAGDADNSVLYRKVSGINLCGARMPRGQAPLSAMQIQLFEDWINAGALND